MPKHAQLRKYPTKRIQKQMKELDRQNKEWRRKNKPQKPFDPGPPKFNEKWPGGNPRLPGTQIGPVQTPLQPITNHAPSVDVTSIVGAFTAGAQLAANEAALWSGDPFRALIHRLSASSLAAGGLALTLGSLIPIYQRERADLHQLGRTGSDGDALAVIHTAIIGTSSVPMGVADGAFGAAIASRGAPHPVAAGAVALGFAAVGPCMARDLVKILFTS